MPFIAISIALHVACLLACVLWPAQWPWWLAAVLGNQALIVALVFLPRAQALGRTVTRLPAPAAMQGWVALTFDDGPDPAVTPQVLELLDRYQAKASFFCIGVAVQRHPDLVREIIARGHSVENHSHSHSPLFAFWGCGRMRQDIERLQQAVQGITGTWPRFFRPTAGFRNPLLDGVLARTGLHLVMWTRRGFDTRCRSAHTVRERLLRGLRAGDILLLHDGNAARTEQGEPLVLAVLPAVLQALQDQGLQAVTLRQGLAGLLDDAGPTPESAAPQSATSCPSLPTNNITP
ncbi:MAG: polysaccharide deacetylase family protein [Brachymonas sp.]|nr:polysaccharide deacetylase family protein [Brachymonas sp.]